jgi:hypothetical protein
MPADISRRELLKAAGGLTFLGLVPATRGRFVLEASSPTRAQPVFTALPYVQPGDNSRLVPHREQAVLAWQTDATPAEFTVVFGGSDRYGNAARVTAVPRQSGDGADADARLNYAAAFGGLALGTRYHYRVSLGARVVAEGYFTTRKPRGAPARFVSFGDNSLGDLSERSIACQAYRARPDFVMNTGDNVYGSGLDHEYAHHFFPVYNADRAAPEVGAPLLRSIPFYALIGNHDVTGVTAGHHPVADFDRHADSLGYFTNMHLPLNAPLHPQPTPIVGAPARLAAFRACAGVRYPRMANYSFDYADGHFLCLDSNLYLDPTDAGFQRWIADDLAGTDAAWKFVVYHHPAFNVGLEHYTEQHMRVLSPIFEQHGVSIVLSGHEHNYQRTRPLRFAPAGNGAAARVNDGRRLVPGRFTVDGRFDGRRVTRPDGVIYLTTGAGGNRLYEPGFTGRPAAWLRPEDGNVAYVERLVADRHSLTVVDMRPDRLVLRQIDGGGNLLDRIRIDRS